MSEVKQYRLTNLSCANCAAKFERNVNELPNVEKAEVNFGASKITVYGQASVEEIDQAGAFDGIKVQREQQGSASYIPFYKQKENIYAGIALGFILIALFFEFVLMLDSPVIVMYVLAIGIGGIPIFKVGLVNLVKFEFDMRTLMTVAIIGAAIIGEWKEAAIVVFLFAVSEALEAYSLNKARNSIAQLMEIAPKTAFVLKKDKDGYVEIETSTSTIDVDDLIRVKPGQKIAMDGIIEEGSSTVNEASITGEPLSVSKKAGDQVFAGTLNEQGSLIVRVTQRVEDSTIAKIIHLVEEAQGQKAPSQKFVDRFAKYYTPAIMLVALLVAIIPPIFTNDWHHWIYQGLAILVVGCPCALVISTPVAIVTAIGNAARNGVLIKGGAYLEQLSHIRTIAFDKTGTLTEGQPVVQQIDVAEGWTEDQLIEAVASVEKHSEHPLAKSILHEAVKRQIHVPTSTDFQSVPGKGAYSTIQGRTIYVGSVSWIQKMVTLQEEAWQFVERYSNEGHSVIAASDGEKLLGLLSITDTVRKEAKQIVQTLNQNGIDQIVMLTGDTELTAQAIGKELGITKVFATLLPQHKLTQIKKLNEEQPVAMVGDGVNDAPALAASTIGIAMGGSGTDVALETADIVLMGDDLTKLPFTIQLSKKTLAIIKQNIAFALIVKLIALLLVIPGWLTLWIAIFADIGATLLVVLNSLRLVKFKVK